jgi:hypothetical protein
MKKEGTSRAGDRMSGRIGSGQMRPT